MMKLKTCILLVLLMAPLASCRTNGGEIGLLYGEWALRSYTVDSEVPEGFDASRFYWAFQGSVISILETFPNHHTNMYFGSFIHSDDVLSLNFAHSNDDENSQPTFDPPKELGFQDTKITVLQIVSLTSRIMVLQFTDNDGRLKVYRLEKLI